MFKKEKGYQKNKAGLEKLRKFVFTYIIDSIYLLLIWIFFLVQVMKHCMLITPLVMYNVYYFWKNFKNNLITLSGWFPLNTH